MSAEHFTHDVFLSHNSKDKAVGRPLAERLQQDGLSPKEECRRQKAEILHSSFIIHRSPCAFGSDWAQLETGTFPFPQKPAVAKPLPRPRWRGRVCSIYELARHNP